MIRMNLRANRNTRLERFEIEQYELHVATYEVEARSVADAIRRLFNGDGDAPAGSEYLGACDQIGMSLEDDLQLAKELYRLGVQVRGMIVPSIRSVRRLGDGEEVPES
jgi:hypothetical protein